MKKNNIFCLLALLFLASCGQDDTQNQPTPTTTTESTPQPTMDADTATPTTSPSVTDKPEESLKLTAEIEYTPVTFNGLTRFELTDNTKGLLLDLDGDGKDEQLYCAKEGIYINGILAASPWRAQNKVEFQPWEQLWLVDVDTSDSFINLIFQLENSYNDEILVWYNGEIKSAEHNNFSHNSFTTAEYRENGTFQIQACHIPLPESIYCPVEFVWDAQDGMRLADQTILLQTEEEAKNREYANDGPWRLISDLKLYTDPQLDAENITVQSGQSIYHLKVKFSDYEHCWIFAKTEHGEEGWFYLEFTDNSKCLINQETDVNDIITGFSTAG